MKMWKKYIKALSNQKYPKTQNFIYSLQYKSENIIQMLQIGKKFQLRFIKLITDIFLNSVLNHYFHLFINLLQFLVVLGILLQREIFNIKNIQKFNNYFITALIQLILVLQFSILVMVTFLLLFQKNQVQQKVFMIEFEGYMTQIVKKIVALFLIVYRKLLGLILLQLSIWVLLSNIQQLSIEWICTIANLSLFVLLYSLSGVNFTSKIAFMPNIVSFGFKTNLQTLMYVYLIIMVVINQFSPQTTIYINLIFSIVCLAVIYVRPLILYRHNTIALVGNGMILGLILARSLYQIFQLKIQTPQQYIYFIASTLLIALMVVKFAHARISCVFMCKIQNTLINKFNTCCKDQVIFYHFVNYEQSQKSIFLFLLHQLQLLKQDKTQQHEGSQKQIIDYSLDSARNQSRLLIEKIIQSLKNSSINDPQVRKFLNQLIFIKYQAIYNPKLLMKSNLGKNEIQQQISNTKHLSMILAQILLLDEINFRRSYTFVKIHQNLLSRIGSLSLISKIEIHALIKIVQNNLKFKTNTLKQYNLKAEQYFVFEQKFQQLKKYVLKACQQKLIFWKENLDKEPDFHKMNQVLQDNYSMNNKIKALSSEITKKFKQKGPIILYNLIASYSAKILNVKLFSTLNPFFSLVKKYKQQMVNEKKQGAFLQNSTIQKYSLLQSIGVCLVDLEKEKGKILWANEDFWTEFYLNRIKTSIDPYSKNEKKSYIFDLMVPQLVFRHDSYFKIFTESQKVNHQHALSFIYQTQTKIITRISTEIQVLPSFRNGFNATVFLFKTPQNQTKLDKFTVLFKQDLEIIGFTGGFLKQKSNFAQSQDQTNEMGSQEKEYLIEQLASNDEFQEFLMQNRNGNKKSKKQIQVYVRESQYKAKFLKVYSLDKKATTNFFQQNFGSFETIDTNPHKAIQKCMYLLQFQKQKSMNTIDANYLNSLLNNGVIGGNVGNDVGHEVDLRSYASLMSSMSTIDNAGVLFNDEAQREKLPDREVKSVQSDKIDKKYKQIMFSKSSKITQYWIIFTTLVGLLLISAMTSNLLIFQSRQQLYQSKLSTIKYFNGLLADICKLCIALREYNYYAYVQSPNDPHIPLLIEQLKVEQSQVEFRLNYLSGYITQKWSAMEILKTAAYNFYLQDAYIVMANYVLSSITYLALVDPQQMNFPLFFAQYIDTIFTPAQVNYNQATYNGIFVVAQNLSNMNEQFLALLLQQLTDIKTQYYIYPCAGGVIVLVVFMVVSIVVERRSENLRESALRMLARLPEKDINEKIANLLQFKHNNCFVLDDYPVVKYHHHHQQQTKQTTETVTTKSDSFRNKQSLKPIINNCAIKRIGGESIGYNDKGSEMENQTKRDLVETEQIYDLQEQTPADERVSNAKRSVIETNVERDDQHDTRRRPKITLPQRRIQRCKFLIYLLFITPSLSYFIVIFLRGFAIDSHITFSLQMATQVYNKTSNHQLVYLLTHETFYFQKFQVFKDYNWRQIVTDQINQAILQDRKLQMMVEENTQAQGLHNMMSKLNNGNLCDEISMFNESRYYDANFTKEQCVRIQSGLLQQGLKPTQNWFLQTAIEIINSVAQPSDMTMVQRYEYLKMPHLQIMKTLLVYLQQFMSIMENTLQIDLNNQISTHVFNIAIYSATAIAAVVVVFVLLRYRWAIVSKHRKEIISILEILSFQTIKKHTKMKQMFNKMQLNIHN